MTRAGPARYAAPGKGARKPPAPKASIGDWCAAVALAERVWRAAEAEDPRSASADPEGDLQKLKVWGGQLAADAFPMPSPVAQLCAGAWLNAVRAMTHATAGPEARTACAALLREATQRVDQLITLHRNALAEPWQRQFRD